jgi:3-hydroxyisobutyrate dehydrogenase-like beta-hydroxyacid dehydrogenase
MKIAVLGIGFMGFPMARRLCEAGHAVHVWNRTREKADRVAAFGATVYDLAASAAAHADIVICVLDSGAVVEQVLFEHGVARSMKRGTLVVDMSSIKPRAWPTSASITWTRPCRAARPASSPARW